MKAIYTLLLCAFTAFSFAGELNPEVDEFNNIRLLGNYKVYFTKGDQCSVKIVNNDEAVEDDAIETTVKKGELEIKIKGDNFKEHNMEVYITYKSIELLDVRRGAWVKFENAVEEDSVSFNVASGGHIVGDVNCKSVYGAISKGGSIKLNGTAARAEYNVFAGGEISCYGVESKNIIAKVRTGGEISVTANDAFDALVFSGGTIRYKGTPNASSFTQEVKIAGDIKQMK